MGSAQMTQGQSLGFSLPGEGRTQDQNCTYSGPNRWAWQGADVPRSPCRNNDGHSKWGSALRWAASFSKVQTERLKGGPRGRTRGREGDYPESELSGARSDPKASPFVLFHEASLVHSFCQYRLEIGHSVLQSHKRQWEGCLLKGHFKY